MNFIVLNSLFVAVVFALLSGAASEEDGISYYEPRAIRVNRQSTDEKPIPSSHTTVPSYFRVGRTSSLSRRLTGPASEEEGYLYDASHAMDVKRQSTNTNGRDAPTRHRTEKSEYGIGRAAPTPSEGTNNIPETQGDQTSSRRSYQTKRRIAPHFTQKEILLGSLISDLLAERDQ